MKAPVARRQIHLRVCPDPGSCRYIGGTRTGVQCTDLDRLLDAHEEQVLHETARELVEEVESMPFAIRRWRLPGALWLARWIDPYVHKKGDPHFTRKKDGSVVRP